MKKNGELPITDQMIALLDGTPKVSSFRPLNLRLAADAGAPVGVMVD
jgi:hypothetical protein